MNFKQFKPMLAAKADLDTLRFPILGSPKLDGIRAAVVGGRLLSRTLKEIPSRHIYNQFSSAQYEGLDGELIVGDPTSKTVYRDTVSGVMADNKKPDFKFYVFDKWNNPWGLEQRLIDLRPVATHDNMIRVQHVVLSDLRDVLAYEEQQLELGYEGIMLADPLGKYKNGRATTKGGELLKVKRFADSEAEVIGVEEEMFNGNDAETNELGRTKRSTAKAGLVGKGTMGALMVRDLVTKVEFNIGTGFTAEDRAWWWGWFLKQDENTPKPIIKYKHFPIGAKDKPRHPVFLGLRPAGA